MGRQVESMFIAPIVAFSSGIVIAKLWPGAPAWGFLLGAHSIVPVWATVQCSLPLASAHWRRGLAIAFLLVAFGVQAS